MKASLLYQVKETKINKWRSKMIGLKMLCWFYFQFRILLHPWQLVAPATENLVQHHSWPHGNLWPLWSCSWGNISRRLRCPIAKRRCKHRGQATTLAVVVCSQSTNSLLMKLSLVEYKSKGAFQNKIPGFKFHFISLLLTEANLFWEN